MGRLYYEISLVSESPEDIAHPTPSKLRTPSGIMRIDVICTGAGNLIVTRDDEVLVGYS